MDSGATKHVVNNLAYSEEVEEIVNGHLTIADGSGASPTHKGKVLIIVRKPTNTASERISCPDAATPRTVVYMTGS